MVGGSVDYSLFSGAFRAYTRINIYRNRYSRVCHGGHTLLENRVLEHDFASTDNVYALDRLGNATTVQVVDGLIVGISAGVD